MAENTQFRFPQSPSRSFLKRKHFTKGTLRTVSTSWIAARTGVDLSPRLAVAKAASASA
jgi:hypothetical protein